MLRESRSMFSPVCLHRRLEKCLQSYSRVKFSSVAVRHTRPAPSLHLRSKTQIGGAGSDSKFDLSSLPASTLGPADATLEDHLLRSVFDSRSEWQEFSSASKRHLGSDHRGLLLNSTITTADSMVEFAERALAIAQRLTAHLESYHTLTLENSDLRPIIHTFDRLSDSLCQVIDMAEFIRTAHPEPSFIAAAEQAHELLMNYMILLNTSEKLFLVLQKVLTHSDARTILTTEERIVAKTLLADFIKNGAGLDDSTRNTVYSLQGEISRLSRDLLTNISPAESSIPVGLTEANGLDPTLVRSMRSSSTSTSTSRRSSLFRNNKQIIQLPTTGPVASMAAASIHDSDVRKRLYIASHTASAERIQTLENLLMMRLVLARTMGSETYSHYALADKMAKTPESVERFLHGLVKNVRPGAESELLKLKALKAKTVKGDERGIFYAWDRDYYISKAGIQNRPRSKQPDFLNAYFSVGVVMQGLSRLFTRLYGIRFVPRETAPDETWSPDVRRLDVLSDSAGEAGGEQLIGLMYCDLFGQGSNRAPAHYTVRCSRRIYGEELEELATSGSAGLGKVPITEKDGKVYQLPTVALVCDFAGRSDGRSTLLSFNEVETLFHEMGHAMHSMLGRTEMHSIAGTRCATDFVELPSVLMEHFASNEAVLRLFARHHETDEPLPMELLNEYLNERDGFTFNSTYTQIELALLDQALHSVGVLQDGNGLHLAKSTSEVYSSLAKEYSLYPAVEGLSWPAMFGHLVGYGSVYYSYLLDRAIAARVWGEVFSSGRGGGSLSREAGERFKSEVLVWGGGRDPWECVAGVLKMEELAAGGEEAMAVVSGWANGM
ncbi:uncharacterized protein V1516DRAFT_671991 [Lipomyces oligophaga]|uniref:uncharacterized protein n=1 Tax=Lipomyces oligophaga TaxID=45792 RepID=UPI0034CE6C7A